MDLRTFERQIEEIQCYLESLQDSSKETDKLITSEHLQQLTAVLASTIEELSVSIEELQQQNDELSATHEQLAYERQRYLDLFEFAPDAYVITDRDLRILEANEATANYLNIKKQFLPGKALPIYFSSEDRQEFYAQFTLLTNSPKLKRFQLQVQPREAEAFPVAVSVSPVYEGNQLTGWRWLLRDITPEKQAEETRQALEEEKELSNLKSRFLQIVSHEFRTPLNVIHVSSQLLQKNRNHYNDHKCDQLFSKIHNSVRHMTKMLEDVLVFNKADLDKQGFQPSLLNVKQLCSEIVEEHLLLSESRYSIDFNCSDYCEYSCFDAKLLKQIVTNLLSNALKYSPIGATVKLSLNCTSSEVKIIVEDSGIGIPEKDLKNLFDPFHRANNIRNIPGTGLGLAIVKKAVDVHEGNISVASTEGEGTTVSITLPVRQLEHKSKQLV